MNEYNISDYSIFSNGINSTNNMKKSVEDFRTAVNEIKTIISDESVFMGPICDSCKSAINQLDTSFSDILNNLSTISSYLESVSSSYKSGDESAKSSLLNIGTSALGSTGSSTNSSSISTTSDNPISSVKIPDSLKQLTKYSVTCYGVGGWYLGGGEKATKVASGTKQEKVHNMWVNSGGNYKTGIATMDVNGQSHYLVATAPKLGTVGDRIKINFKNGQSINCVIADAKSTHDANYTEYGSKHGDATKMLEFEVDRNVYLAKNKSRPSTSEWGLEWDSTSEIASVDNYGSLIGK